MLTSEPCEGQCHHYLNKHRPFFQKKSVAWRFSSRIAALARRPSGRFADFSEIGVHTCLCLKLVRRRGGLIVKQHSGSMKSIPSPASISKSELFFRARRSSSLNLEKDGLDVAYCTFALRPRALRALWSLLGAKRTCQQLDHDCIGKQPERRRDAVHLSLERS